MFFSILLNGRYSKPLNWRLQDPENEEILKLELKKDSIKIVYLFCVKQHIYRYNIYKTGKIPDRELLL